MMQVVCSNNVPTHNCHILETGNDSYRFKHSTGNQKGGKTG